ncbi:lipase 3-like [Hermetia illucens]|nr:lipase 3-like [Hermetia illucens]
MEFSGFKKAEMFRILCLLLLGQFVVGYLPKSYQAGLEGRTSIDDLVDEDYDEEAKLEEQAAIDAELKKAIHRATKNDGYPLEEHSVVTEDGYILTVHRIPYAKNNKAVENKPVVFLQHGLLSCSYHWIIQGPGKALAYILADAGYDVWLGNVRGNSYSKDHISLDPKKRDFWSFSWNEMGYYDLPAMIDYVLANTGQSGLNYIGHSQGTTSFFVMGSLRPEYNQKIKAFHALAPIAFMSNMYNPLVRLIAPFVADLGAVSKILGNFELLPSSKLISTLGTALCKDGSPFQAVCTNMLFLFCGFSHENMDTSLFPEIMKTSPAGASINQLIHYAQGYKSAKFRKFDFGLIKNLAEYKGSPPDYPLGKITAPVHLYYSGNDWLAGIKDVQILASKLPNVVYNKKVPHDTFNHLDFMWGKYADVLVYDDLLYNIRKYT